MVTKILIISAVILALIVFLAIVTRGKAIEVILEILEGIVDCIDFD